MDEDEIQFYIFIENLFDCIRLLPNYYFSVSLNLENKMFYQSKTVLYLHISKSFEIIKFSYTQNSISFQNPNPDPIQIPDISIIRVISLFSKKKLSGVYLNRVQVFNTKTSEIRDF